MQIFVILIACSVLGIHDWLLNFLLGGFVFMDFVAFLKYLTADCGLGCGFLLFGGLKQVYENLGVFLLVVGFGLKFVSSDWFSRVFVKLLGDLRGRLFELRNGLGFKNVCGRKLGTKKLLKEEHVHLIDKTGEVKEKSKKFTDSDVNMNADSDANRIVDSDDDRTVEDDVFDGTKLRKMIKIERRRAIAELERERSASATAAEEAMAMILRLQNEKSVLEMELNQYRRLAEEKQIHDQQVIQSLQWLLLRHESERDSLQKQLNSSSRKLKRFWKSDESEEVDEASSSFNGNISDALENVFYSSRDDNL